MPDQGRDRSIADLFLRACELDGTARRELLDRECSGDPELRDEVETLLARDRDANDGEATEELAAGIRHVAAGWAEAASWHGSGRRIGSYRLLRKLGEGGMGEVWEAEQQDTGRRVALKLISAGLAGNEQAKERFLREGRLAANVSHPRSTFVFETGEADGRLFIVMELMPGQTLRDLVDQEGLLPIERAVDAILDVAQGLEAAHRTGVIHRDVKPSNCFLDSQGRVKVGDYGLSKSLVTKQDLTRSQSFLGTPAFASPEQVRGQELDERSDQHAVGATLFFLLVGSPPFRGDAIRMSARIATDPAPSVRSLREELPADLSRIVARTLEKDPAKRFRSMGELRDALLPYATGGTVPANPGRRLLAFVIDLTLFYVATNVLTFVAVASTPLSTVAEDWYGKLDWMLGVAEVVVYVLVDDSVFGVLLLALNVSYFAGCEATWGCTLGKRLLSLRVLGPDGSKPPWWRALIRAALVPGAMVGVSIALGSFIDDTGPAVVSVALTLLVTWLPVLAVVSTMRQRSGYRALHDLTSQTRVLLLREAHGAETRIPTSCGPEPDSARQFGPFQETEIVRRAGSESLVGAFDDRLGRPVWVRVADREDPLPLERLRVARPGRMRWLQSGRLDDQFWHAFEAPGGVPFESAARSGDGLDWEIGRVVLRDLAEELDAALDDGTLYRHLTINDVWAGRTGRGILVDVGNATESSPEENPDGPAGVEKAVGLLKEAATASVAGAGSPDHARRFVAELASRPAIRETLGWTAKRLRDLSGRLVSLTWYRRLGVLALSVSIEASLYSTVGLLLGSAVDEASILLLLLLPLAAPVLAGAVSRGGLVFRVMGIEVRRRDGSVAGPLRCAWRSALAWSPSTLVFALPAVAFSPRSALLPVLIAGLIAVPLLLYALIYSVMHPYRGLQDLLAGTRLAPR